jgi:hypothetical protein
MKMALAPPLRLLNRKAEVLKRSSHRHRLKRSAFQYTPSPLLERAPRLLTKLCDMPESRAIGPRRRLHDDQRMPACATFLLYFLGSFYRSCVLGAQVRCGPGCGACR